MSKKRRYHGLGDLVSMPALSDFNPLEKRADGTDVLLGVAAGVIGGGFVKKGIEKLDESMKSKGGKGLPEFVTTNVGAVGALGIAAAAVLFAPKIRAIASRADGLYLGALTVAGAKLLSAFAPKLGLKSLADWSDVVAVQMGGVIVNEPARQMNGVIVDEARPQLGDGTLDDLANAASFADDEEYAP